MQEYTCAIQLLPCHCTLVLQYFVYQEEQANASELHCLLQTLEFVNFVRFSFDCLVDDGPNRSLLY